jgi:protein ImuB
MPWEQLRERLRARLGDDAVQGVGLRAEHRPERASGTAAQAIKGPPPTLPLRPGWLLATPQPLYDPDLRILSGPERIESGWWDEGDVRRDYYVVETVLGQRAWAYTAAGARHGPFMLHGWFA